MGLFTLLAILATGVLPPENLENYLAKNPSHEIVASEIIEQIPPEGSTWTGGHIENLWQQISPWKDMCPTDTLGNRCLPGCVAIAESNIVDFHFDRRDEMFKEVNLDSSDSYTSIRRGDTIEIPGDSEERHFPDFDELNEYIKIVRNHYRDNIPLTDQDNAAMAFFIGVLDRTKYHPPFKGSGGSSLRAFITAERLGFESEYFIWVPHYKEEFFDSLDVSIREGCPVFLIISDSNYTYLHAIVCDGLRKYADGETDYHAYFGMGTEAPKKIEDCWFDFINGQISGYQEIIAAVFMKPLKKGIQRTELAYDEYPYYNGKKAKPKQMVASRFSPPDSDLEAKLKYLRYFIPQGEGPVEAVLFADNRGKPGEEIIAKLFTPDRSTWYEIDVSHLNFIPTEDFYVGLRYLDNSGSTFYAIDSIPNDVAFFSDNGNSWESTPEELPLIRAILETGEPVAVREQQINSLDLTLSTNLTRGEVRLNPNTNEESLVSIYDAIGRRVRPQFFIQGPYSLDFNDLKLPSGQYFIALTQKDKRDVEQITFIK